MFIKRDTGTRSTRIVSLRRVREDCYIFTQSAIKPRILLRLLCHLSWAVKRSLCHYVGVIKKDNDIFLDYLATGQS